MIFCRQMRRILRAMYKNGVSAADYQEQHSGVGDVHQGDDPRILRKYQLRRLAASDERRESARPVGKTADKEVQHTGRGDIDNAANEDNGPCFVKFRPYLRA